MKPYANMLKQALLSEIQEITERRKEFCRNPERDFTRNRKLPFDKVLKILVGMGGNPLRSELLTHLGYSQDAVSVPAFVQQRSKILPDALATLFHRFSDKCTPEKLYKGYRLFAVDGSDLQFAANPQDKASYFPGCNGQLHYSFLHLNAMFDLCSGTYLDAIVQKRRNTHENSALIQMVERTASKAPALVIADRGYESYNVMEHIAQKGWKYLIRIKDTNGIISGFACKDHAEFDTNASVIFTRKQTNEVKQLMKDYPRLYRYLPQKVTFDFLPQKSADFYSMSFRIVRFRLTDNTFQTVVTNLEPDLFPPEELKQIYHLRWGVETSFRQLKYTVGLRQFQSKKVEHVIQEIFARLLMYNFTELITLHVTIPNCNRKYAYQANFSAAVHICRQFFRGAVSPPLVEALIAKHLVPIRPGRALPRNLNHIRFTGFYYRIA